MTGINAKDRTKTQAVGGMKIPELEGRVKIELFNAKTGEKEQEVEGKNIVTDVVKDVFADNVFGMTQYWRMFPIMDVFFGGILCFRDALTEEASNYYPPTTNVNPVVAHAGDTSTSAQEQNDSTMGHPTSEAGEVTNGYKRVWEFGSTQGNGTISALAMTHPDTGHWWLFNGTSFGSILQISINQNGNGQTQNANGMIPNFYNATKRTAYLMYSPNSSPNTLYVREFANYGIQDEIGLLEKSPVGAIPTGYTEHTFTITNAATAYYLIKDGNIHVLNCSGTTISRTIINTTSWETSSDTLTVSGVNMQNMSQYTENIKIAKLVEMDDAGYIYIFGASKKLYKIKYSNVTDVSEMDSPGTPTIQGGGIINLGKMEFWQPRATETAYIVDGNVVRAVSGVSGNDSSGPWWSGYNGSGRGFLSNGCKLVRSTGWGMASASADQCNRQANVLSKLFMSTVKNLDTAVTKTSTQTMKITYTITEVQANS